MRRQARLLRDPIYQAALRERERLRAERENAVECPPTFDTAYLASQMEKGLDSSDMKRYFVRNRYFGVNASHILFIATELRGAKLDFSQGVIA